MNENDLKSPSELNRRTIEILLALIFIGAIARLYKINNPLMEWRWWRPHETAALARNFYEGDMNILYPQVDWRGDTTGYVESEFPIYPYMVANLYRVFGVHESLGRILNIFFYVLSASLLFQLTRRVYDKRAALIAVIFYSIVPLSFFYTRSFWNDVLLSLCSIAGVYFFLIWTDELRIRYLLLSLLGICIAVLVKPPSLYLGIPILYLSYRKFGWRLFKRIELWFYVVGVLVPTVIWYYHGYHLWRIHGNTFGIIGINTTGIIWPLNDRRWLSLVKALSYYHIFEVVTPFGFLFLLLGIFTVNSKQHQLFHWWVVGFILYILLVPSGHRGHDYYQLPIVFPFSAFMGFGANLLLKQKIFSKKFVVMTSISFLGFTALCVFLFLLGHKTIDRLIVAIGITIFSLLCVSVFLIRKSFSKLIIISIFLAIVGFSIWQLNIMMQIKDIRLERITFGDRVNKVTEPSELIVFMAPKLYPKESHPEWYRHRTPQGEYLYCDPVDFYLSHRKGWSIDEEQATPEFLETLRQRGAKYLATFYPDIFERNPKLKPALDLSYTPVEITKRWAIYRLDDKYKDE